MNPRPGRLTDEPTVSGVKVPGGHLGNLIGQFAEDPLIQEIDSGDPNVDAGADADDGSELSVDD